MTPYHFYLHNDVPVSNRWSSVDSDIRRTSHLTVVRGYTLLELIVSVGVFSMVMLAATGAYLNLIRLDRQTRAVNDIVTNLSFAVDTMAREIRTGTGYQCEGATNCPSSGTWFRFTDSKGRVVTYQIVSGKIVATTAGIASELTDPRITISSLRFYVRGVGTTGADLLLQPQVTFAIRGSIVAGTGNTIPFSVQSSATQRLIELP